MSLQKNSTGTKRRHSISANRRIGFFAPANLEYIQRMMDGVLRYQADRGGCVVRDFRFDPDEPEDRDEWARRHRPWDDWKPDGLVVKASPDPGLYDWIADAGYKVINIGSFDEVFPSVLVSTDGLARVAVEHFQSLGLKHVAYVTTIAGDRRIASLRSRLEPLGIVLQTAVLDNCPSYWDFFREQRVAGDAGLCRMLTGAPGPLGVLAVNDDVGRVVCLAAQRLGLNIPTEVAVLGIGNSAQCRACSPPLSSIQARVEEIGYRAMELLIRMIDRVPTRWRTEVEPGRVVVRASTSLASAPETDGTRAIQLIRERAHEGITIDQILDELQISRATLHRAVNSAIGRSPGEELARVKLERAKELLQTTDLPVTQIATMSGYHNPFNFATHFRKKTDTTPSDFRTRHRGK